jgi:energy-coupling factor transporter ATP-binding protein EcfA2
MTTQKNEPTGQQPVLTQDQAQTISKVGEVINSLTKINSQVEVCLASGIGKLHSDGGKNPKPLNSITLDAIQSMLTSPQAVDKDSALWAIFSDVHTRSLARQKESGNHYALWADLDLCEGLTFEGIKDAVQRAVGSDVWVYSSRSATLKNPKCRVIVPLLEPVKGVDYSRLQKALNNRIEKTGLKPDRSTERISQICYLPNRGEYYEHYLIDLLGGLDVNNWAEDLAKLVAMEQAAQAELKAKQEQARLKVIARMQSDQLSPVDTFKRHYPLTLMLESCGYLQRGDRWLSPNSESGVAGVKISDDGLKWFSQHGSDIGIGQTTNGTAWGDAFDLFVQYNYGSNYNAAVKAAGEMFTNEQGVSITLQNQRNHMANKPNDDVIIEFDFIPPNHAEGVVEGDAEAEARMVAYNDRLNYLLPEFRYDVTNIKPVEYVVDGFFSNKMTLIAGAPGSGKSTALVSLTAIVAGIVITDDIKVELQRKIFYVTEDAEQIERILFGLRHQGLTTWTQGQIAESFVIINARRRPHAEIASMVQAARHTGKTQHKSGYEVEPLIVLDTSNATIDLDNENDNSEAGKAIAAIKETLGNACLWIVGHTAKAINRADLKSLSFRGASAFEGDANATSYLFTDESAGKNVRFLALGKRRFTAEFDEIRIDVTTGSMEAVTPWGTTQKTFYSVGRLSRSSAEVRQELTKAARDEGVAEQKQKMLERIAYSVANENAAGEPLNRERLKKMIGGNGKMFSDLVAEMIFDGWIKEVKAQGKKGYDLISLKVPDEQAVQPDVEGSIAALLSKAKDAEVGTIRNDLASLVG